MCKYIIFLFVLLYNSGFTQINYSQFGKVKEQGQTINSKKEGVWTELYSKTYNNYNILVVKGKGEYRLGLKQGTWEYFCVESYLENGKPCIDCQMDTIFRETQNYLDGKRQGVNRLILHYYRRTFVIDGNYMNNSKEGPWYLKSPYGEGNLLLRRDYSEYIIEYGHLFDTLTPNITINYQNNKKNGLSIITANSADDAQDFIDFMSPEKSQTYELNQFFVCDFNFDSTSFTQIKSKMINNREYLSTVYDIECAENFDSWDNFNKDGNWNESELFDYANWDGKFTLFTLKGFYKNNMLDSTCVISRKNLDFEYRVTSNFKEGKVHGQVKMEHLRSDKSETAPFLTINYQNGLPHGDYYSNEELISSSGKFINGKKIGQWKEGKVIDRDSETKIFEQAIGNYEEGIKVGEWKVYINDVLSSTGKFKRVNVETFSSNYKEYRLEGVWKLYNEDGTLRKTKTYSEGECIEGCY